MDTSQGNNHAGSAGHGQLHQISCVFAVAASPIEMSVCSLSSRFHDVAHRENFLTDANGFEMATRTDDV
jgi:hypothetical protein